MTEKQTAPVLSPRTGKPLFGVALRNHLRKLEGLPPVKPAPKGNTRAAKAGLTTQKLIAPRRAAHIKVLREDYPHLDGRRLALLADRLARIDLATAWLESQDNLVRNKDGDVYNVAILLDKWSTRAEQVLAEAEKEGRGKGRVDLATEMAALEEGEAA